MTTPIEAPGTGGEAEQATIYPDEIDLSFAPRQRPSVHGIEMDGELLLVDTETVLINVLNPTAAITWQCLDGEATLEEIAEDLADAFGAALETVSADVLAIARDLGRLGLLAGVSPPPPTELTVERPGLGDTLTAFELPDAGGSPRRVPGRSGGRTLVVNWSPFCGFCSRIAGQLGELEPELRAKDVDLVLVTVGTVDDNSSILEPNGLSSTAVYRAGASEDFVDPFPFLGTPVAYVIDDQGRVTAPLAYGAVEVPDAARELAGLPPLAPEIVSAGGLPAASGVCGPSSGVMIKHKREWAPTSAYKVGEYVVGVRGESERTDRLLGAVFASQRQPAGTGAPDNFSLVLADPDAASTRATPRELNLLLAGDNTVARTRSPRRAVSALASHLSSLLGPPEGLIEILAIGALTPDGRAMLLPRGVQGYAEQTQPKLARLGVRLSDAPKAYVDLGSAELVVTPIRVELDAAKLAGLPEPPPSKAELPAVEPGRYPLAVWLIQADDESAVSSPAHAIAATLSFVNTTPEALPETVDGLRGLLQKVSVAVTSRSTIDDLLSAVARLLD